MTYSQSFAFCLSYNIDVISEFNRFFLSVIVPLPKLKLKMSGSSYSFNFFCLAIESCVEMIVMLIVVKESDTSDR